MLRTQRPREGVRAEEGGGYFVQIGEKSKTIRRLWWRTHFHICLFEVNAKYTFSCCGSLKI